MFPFFAFSTIISLASSSCIPPTQDLHKRNPQFDSPPDMSYDSPPDTPISFGPVDLPPHFLPPPWSPYSGLDSPYPSPIDDGGRSQMVDNEIPQWFMCPSQHFDCRKCPKDARCRRSNGSDDVESGNMGSGSGSRNEPQSIEPEDDGQRNCPLQKCDDKISRCGRNARCTRGFCVCGLGRKGSFRDKVGNRGNEGLGAVTVYNDPFADCDSECDDLSCREVPQLEVGVCFRNGVENGWKGDDGHSAKAAGSDGLETDGVASGGISLPSVVDLDLSVLDYVGGVADMGAVGESN